MLINCFNMNILNNKILLTMIDCILFKNVNNDNRTS